MDDFSRLSELAFAAYEEGRFGDLLELVDEHRGRFPERAPTMRFWEACVLARLDRAEEAVAALERGLAEGMWWAREMLVEDEDLQLLSERSDFQGFVKRSARIAEDAPADSAPPVVRGAGERGSLIALHGSGESPSDAAASWSTAPDLGVQLIVARSAKRFAPDLYSWDKAGFAKDLQTTLEVTDAFTPIVLGGFSQGASLPLMIALRGEIAAAGVIAVCPTIQAESELVPMPEEMKAAIESGDRGVRVFVIIGGKDPLGPAGLEAAEAIEAAGYAIHVERRPDLGHAFPEDFTDVLPAALDFVLEGS